MNNIYVTNSEKLRNLLKEFVTNFDTIRNTAKFLKTGETNLQRWIRGERSVPFKIVETIAKYEKFNILEFLDGERIKSGTSKNTFRINYGITEFECLLIGWILTDGHLGEKDPVTISQKSKETLEELKSIIENQFDFENVNIYPDRDNWKLQISSLAFCEYLKFRYSLPFGKKANIIEVPKNIFDLPIENKLAFITGCIEGDGSFSTFIRKSRKGTYRVPRIMINSNSKIFLEGIKNLLENFGITSTINSDRTKYKLSISRLENCVKLFYYIYPYMIAKMKISNFISSFSDRQILNILTIKNTRELIYEWKNNLDNSWKILKKILENNYDYEVSFKTIRLLGLSSNRSPLSAVIEACKTLNKDIFNYIPNWYVGILWLHKLISKNKFEEIRGLKLREL